MCDDISAPESAWEIEHYANMTQPGICDYCENETDVNGEGWCRDCASNDAIDEYYDAIEFGQ